MNFGARNNEFKWFNNLTVELSQIIQLTFLCLSFLIHKIDKTIVSALQGC